ncbi:unnamed protein product [Psylliodes chrysocephalus]|uniref:Uncharacterized protein n=1 Tax=Psylliodes chrysocephalus TaxID=3402493 RepID=A0A9P0CFM6_9CUCU|nr:unnamed protein product [Psylliodes chrysocephala]
MKKSLSRRDSCDDEEAFSSDDSVKDPNYANDSSSSSSDSSDDDNEETVIKLNHEDTDQETRWKKQKWKCDQLNRLIKKIYKEMDENKINSKDQRLINTAEKMGEQNFEAVQFEEETNLALNVSQTSSASLHPPQRIGLPLPSPSSHGSFTYEQLSTAQSPPQLNYEPLRPSLEQSYDIQATSKEVSLPNYFENFRYNQNS